MCGLAGIIDLKGRPVPDLERRLSVMNWLIEHRGPDDHAIWMNADQSAGLAHRRLSILDLSPAGRQPMASEDGRVIVFNGEIYNFIELAEAQRGKWNFHSRTDTETILATHAALGHNAPNQLRGMFAYAIWDEPERSLFAVRDRFGIKPFYYAEIDGALYFASEIKALLPFLQSVDIDTYALTEFFTFQFNLDDQTLFKGVKQLAPAHTLSVRNGRIETRRYWDVQYNVDFDHTSKYFTEQLRELVDESIRLHLRADVPVGAYVSGGIDSSLVALLSAQSNEANQIFFHGKFTEFPGYDESPYAEIVARQAGAQLHQIDISSADFLENIRKVVYYLDHPVAGPGSFPQYMVSKLAAEHVKVVLGGQGGDEIFGGYARYLVAYLEQCLKAGIEGTLYDGNYVVTLESIIPQLGLLREYKPMLKNFWSEGLFDPLDARYFRLVNRGNTIQKEVCWDELPQQQVYERFREEFNRSNVGKEAYLDKMTHFDFKFLLPALLQVEDRMSMAHGLESRVPLLDHRIVEFAATMPADVKYADGRSKQVLKDTFVDILPSELTQRRDKMGFPVPLKEWTQGDLRDFVHDVFDGPRAGARPFMDKDAVLANFGPGQDFTRKSWGLLSLELWYQEMVDGAKSYGELKRQVSPADEPKVSRKTAAGGLV